MRVNPYGEDPVRLAIDLVNDPPESWRDLADRCTAAGVIIPEGSEGESEVLSVKRLMEDWLRIVDAPSPEQRATVLNQLLESSSTHPMLTNHAGTEWHLHYRPDEARLADVLASMIYVGTALHLVGRGMHRLGSCQLEECPRIFVDLSRPGTQRHCSAQCANRNAVRRHRALRH